MSSDPSRGMELQDMGPNSQVKQLPSSSTSATPNLARGQIEQTVAGASSLLSGLSKDLRQRVKARAHGLQRHFMAKYEIDGASSWLSEDDYCVVRDVDRALEAIATHEWAELFEDDLTSLKEARDIMVQLGHTEDKAAEVVSFAREGVRSQYSSVRTKFMEITETDLQDRIPALGLCSDEQLSYEAEILLARHKSDGWPETLRQASVEPDEALQRQLTAFGKLSKPSEAEREALVDAIEGSGKIDRI